MNIEKLHDIRNFLSEPISNEKLHGYFSRSISEEVIPNSYHRFLIHLYHETSSILDTPDSMIAPEDMPFNINDVTILLPSYFIINKLNKDEEIDSEKALNIYSKLLPSLQNIDQFYETRYKICTQRLKDLPQKKKRVISEIYKTLARGDDGYAEIYGAYDPERLKKITRQTPINLQDYLKQKDEDAELISYYKGSSYTNPIMLGTAPPIKLISQEKELLNQDHNRHIITSNEIKLLIHGISQAMGIYIEEKYKPTSNITYTTFLK